MSGYIKIITIIIICILLFSTGYGTNYLITKNRIEQQSFEYRIKVDRFERQLIAERDKYNKLGKLNNTIQDRLDNSINSAERATTLVGTISKGLSGDIENLEGIIRTLRIIREGIEEYNSGE